MTSDDKYRIYMEYLCSETLKEVADANGLTTAVCTRYVNEFRNSTTGVIKGLSPDKQKQFTLLFYLSKIYTDKNVLEVYRKFNAAGIYTISDLTYKGLEAVELPVEHKATFLRIMPFKLLKSLQNYPRLQAYPAMQDSILKHICEKFSASSYYELYMRYTEIESGLSKYHNDLLEQLHEYNLEEIFSNSLSSHYDTWIAHVGATEVTKRAFIILNCYIPNFSPVVFTVTDNYNVISEVLNSCNITYNGKKITMTTLKKLGHSLLSISNNNLVSNKEV